MMGAYVRAFGLFGRDLRLLLLASALVGFSYSGLYFLLAGLFVLRLGFGLEFVGVFVSTGAFSYALFALLAGALGRRLGARPVMAVGAAILFLGYTLLPLAVFVSPSGRAVWLIAFCALRELGNALFLVNSYPYMMEITSARERRHAFALRASLTPLGGFGGSLLGGVLPALCARFMGRPPDDPLNYALPLLLGGVLLAAAWAALAATRPGENERRAVHSRRGENDAAPWGPIVFMLGVGLLFIAAQAAAQTFFNVYMDAMLKAPTARIGTAVAAGQLAAVLAALGTPALLKRWGNAGTFALVSALTACCLLPLALIPHWLAASAGFVALVGLSAVAFPVSALYHQEMVAPQWRPSMSGAFNTALALGWTLVASGGGYLIALRGYSFFFLLAALLTATSAALLRTLGYRYQARQRVAL